MSRKKSPGEANRLLVEYENLNSDLPQTTRRQLAIFALAPTTGTEALEEVFGVSLGQTPFRHRAWFWWNALRTSGLARAWERMAEMRSDGGSTGEALRWIRDEVASEEEWTDLSRRVGTPVLRGRTHLRPSRYREAGADGARTIWTKGGTWWKDDNFTKILVMKGHLDPRPPGNAWTRRLGPDGVRKIERELHGLVDPDRMLAPQARRRAVQYVRRRVPEILGYDRPRASYRTAAWFFQAPVMDEEGWIWDPETIHRIQPPYQRQVNGRDWRWDWIF